MREAQVKGAKSSSAVAREKPGRGGGGSRWRGRRFAIGLMLLVLAAVVAYLQPPRPDPYQPVDTLSPDWWFYPIERNAFQRLPAIGADLRDVFALEGTQKVWVVGTGGMILHSADGGFSWEQQKVQWDTRPEVPEELPLEDAPPSELSLLWLLPPEARADDAPTYQRGVREDSTEARRQIEGTRSDVDSLRDGGEPPTSGDSTRSREMSPGEASDGRSRDLLSIWFVDERRGWAVGAGGTILATTDGGAEWLPQASGTPRHLQSVHFLSDGLRGLVVGREGTILATRNGGATWERQKSGTRNALYDLQFLPDGQQGWVVGNRGTVLATVDGGTTWNPRDIGAHPLSKLGSVHFLASGQKGWVVGEAGTVRATVDAGLTWESLEIDSPEPLAAAFFLPDGQRGWVSGIEGSILTTSNGGSTWEAQQSGTSRWLMAIHFLPDGEHGWVVGSDGFILATDDGGETWETREGGIARDLFSVQILPDGRRGWAFGEVGTILATDDGGATWEPQQSGTRRWLWSGHFLPDGESGWAVGSQGTILVTDNGGATWGELQSGTDRDFSCVHFLQDDLRGWVVGEAGTILSTDDGGITWIPQQSGSDKYLWCVRFLSDDLRGWAVGQQGTMLSTSNGGATWESHGFPTTRVLLSVYFLPDGQRGWVVGESGLILATSDGGANWRPLPSGSDHLQWSVEFLPDGQRGWTAGEAGRILATSDGGATWEVQQSGTRSELISLRFLPDGQQGLVVGRDGMMLRTSNAGVTWSPPLPYRKSPAPWYWAMSLLLVLAVMLPALRKPEPIAAEKPTIADMLASDRPLRAGDPDPLDFHSLAGGVSRFLANQSTEPPLTIAITGEWGTGKSSLMALIQDDLRGYRFPTVWFNAWHHQTEEHLLASLMHSIHRQAIPSWWSLAGLGFRARLLCIRGMKHWLLAAILLFVIAALIGLASRGVPVDLPKGGSFVAWLIAAVGSVVTIGRAVRTFSSTPSRIVSSLSGALRISELGMETGFRQRFAQVFDEVTRALRPQRMAVFIDDLDRCQPANTVAVLEMVNFLVSSGDCYVVMGIAPQLVVRSVGLGFKEMAEEMSVDNEPVDESSPSNAKEIRRAYALKYLGKLINIEVPVPLASVEASSQLLVESDSESMVQSGLVERIKGWFLKVVPKYGALFIAVALLGLGFAYGPHCLSTLVNRIDKLVSATDEGSEVRDAAEVQSIDLESGIIELTLTDQSGRRPVKLEVPFRIVADTSLAGTVPPPGPTGLTGPTGSVDTTRVRDSASSGIALFDPGQEDRSRWPLFAGAVVVALLVFGIVRLSIQPKSLEGDSETFKKALALWHPLVYAAGATPRSMKRFLNRVRYYAMCQRPRQEPPPSLLDRIASVIRWRGRPKPEKAPEGEGAGWIPEDILVALGTIEHAHRQWLDDERLWADLGTYVSSREEVPKKLRDASEIREYGSAEAYREQFRKLSEGICLR